MQSLKMELSVAAVLVFHTLFSWFLLVESANILLSGTYGEGSHFTALVPIGRSLVKQGHNVTFLISDEYAYRSRDSELSNLFHFEIFSHMDPDYHVAEFFRRFAEIGFLGSDGLLQNLETVDISRRSCVEMCESVLLDHALMGRLQQIDAIVTEAPWPCGFFIKSYLSRHSRSNKSVRLILSSATAPIPSMLTMSGTPFNPSYQPSSFTGFTPSMTLMQRTINTLYLIGSNIFVNFFISRLSVIVDKFDLDSCLKSRACLHKYVDLYLTNMDFSTEFAFPLMPNVIPVGGVTASPGKALDPHVEDFVSGSGENGVVLFAMGSYFADFTSYRRDILDMLLHAFARIPQRVVMQMKPEVASEVSLPPNVRTMAWLPQNDLLAHPKTRAFVSHAGNNGYLESVYHGVPMLVIPLFGDHFDVTVRVVSSGLGLMMDKNKVSADLIYDKLFEILNGPKYAETAKRLSAIIRDRPLAAADRAAFWINHVIKHGGEHMRSPGQDLSFISYNLIDVVVLLSLSCSFIFYVGFAILKWCFSRCQKKYKSDVKKSDVKRD